MRSTVKDLMTTPVVAVRENASFKEIVSRMRDSRVSAFPVVDREGKVIGVVSEADMLNKEADEASAGTFASMLRFRDHEKAAGVTAADLMTSPAATIGPDEAVVDAARLMRDRRIKRLPVTRTYMAPSPSTRARPVVISVRSCRCVITLSYPRSSARPGP